MTGLVVIFVVFLAVSVVWAWVETGPDLDDDPWQIEPRDWENQ